jgi:hypothetical protein
MVELTTEEANQLYSYLMMLSGRLKSQRASAYSTTEKLILEKNIGEVENFAQSIVKRTDASK